jgi:hypothetical protein
MMIYDMGFFIVILLICFLFVCLVCLCLSLSVFGCLSWVRKYRMTNQPKLALMSVLNALDIHNEDMEVHRMAIELGAGLKMWPDTSVLS